MNLADVIFVEDLIVFVFRMINFGVILALLIYSFKVYLLPSLYQSYTEYYDYFKKLATDHKELLSTHTVLERQLQDEAREQDYLKERLMRWQAVVQEKDQRARAAHAQHKKLLQERLAHQYAMIAEHHLYQQLFPRAVADARARLEKQAATAGFQQKVIEQSKLLLRKASIQ